jgi:Tol biopolymer transport system component
MIQQPDGTVVQLADPTIGAMMGPSFDRTGERIAFTATAAGAGIYTTRSAGNWAMFHLTDGELDAIPMWAGDRVAFTRYDANRTPHVWIVPADGSQPAKLALDNRVTISANLATGEILLMSLEGQLWWWKPETGKQRPGPVWKGKGLVEGATVSPNGKWILFLIDGGQDLWRQRLDPPGPLEHVLDLGNMELRGGEAIKDDGNVLISPRRWGGELYVVPVEPGTTI